MVGPDWTLLRSFIAVGDEGSLSAAARRLHLSQPTLGRHVAELEAALGIVLFTRSRDGYALTERGAALHQRARPMADDAAAVLRLAEGRSERLAGTVRIAASEVVAAHVLPPIIARLIAEEPGLEIEITASNRVENLLRRDADIAVRMVRPEQNSLVASHVADLRLVACASRAYLARAGRPKTPEDLYAHVLLGLDRDDSLVRGMKAVGYEASRQTFRFRCDNHLVIWQAIRAGTGIGFAQASLVARDPEVEVVLPDLPVPVLPMWLAYHRDLRNAPRIRRTADFLRTELKAYAAA